jgi:cytochrome c oxidase cbb3-type subunit 4
MDYGVIHTIATITAILALAGVCWWAFSPVNRKRFEDDAMLPLQTDPLWAPEKARAKEMNK